MFQCKVFSHFCTNSWDTIQITNSTSSPISGLMLGMGNISRKGIEERGMTLYHCRALEWDMGTTMPSMPLVCPMFLHPTLNKIPHVNFSFFSNTMLSSTVSFVNLFWIFVDTKIHELLL